MSPEIKENSALKSNAWALDSILLKAVASRIVYLSARQHNFVHSFPGSAWE
jgi:hypothetical protein